MNFVATPIPGAFLVETTAHVEARGSFSRSFCEAEFSSHGLAARFEQHSISSNREAGTVRGMHFSRPPAAETKLVRCISGAIHDVIVDLRRASPTYLQTFSVELSSTNQTALLIPVGCAHGFQTLVDDSAVLYLITPSFNPAVADGVRYDDSPWRIVWPLPVTSIAEKDLRWTDWSRRSPIDFAVGGAAQ